MEKRGGNVKSLRNNGKRAPAVECLQCEHLDLSYILSTEQEVCICNPGAEKVEAGGPLWLEGQPWW